MLFRSGAAADAEHAAETVTVNGQPCCFSGSEKIEIKWLHEIFMLKYVEGNKIMAMATSYPSLLFQSTVLFDVLVQKVQP